MSDLCHKFHKNLIFLFVLGGWSVTQPKGNVNGTGGGGRLFKRELGGDWFN